MSHKQISLSAGEWQIMERLWEKQPMTLMELVRAPAPETGWSKSTIVTMVTRLEAKGAVRHEEGVRAKAYYPAVDRETAARAETESFLGKVYGGSLGLLVSAMVESRALTEEDLAELSAILEKGGEKP